MDRLTTNKDISEMNMLELATNCCYANNKHVRYRDFETDIDARVLTRKLLKKYAESDDAFTDDLDFDEQMLDLLQYGTETMEGLIALFYRNLWAMAELREKLMEYEEAEEKGLLCKLPCKVGTHIYIVNRYWVDEGIICGLAECDDVDCACFKVYEDPDTYTMVAFNEFNKTWFLTESDAEKAVQEGYKHN